MSPLAVLALQIAASFVAIGAFAHLLVAPYLRTRPPERALAALLWVHVPRYVPLALLAPGQIDPAVSGSVANTIAWGDFTSAVFALAAIVALHRRGVAAIGWVRVFSVVSTLDIGLALAVGLGAGVYEHDLGVAWYVLTSYVPLVCVAQAMILARLAGGGRHPRRAGGVA